MQWLTIENPKSHQYPMWLRSFAVEDDGQVWMPAALAGDEATTVLCLAFDGEEGVERDGHVYVRASWLAREFPHTRAACSGAERRGQEHLLA